MKKTVSAVLLALLPAMTIAADWTMVNESSPYLYDKSSIKIVKAIDDSLFIEVWITAKIYHKNEFVKVLEKRFISCGEGRYMARVITVFYESNGKKTEIRNIKDIDKLEWENAVPNSNDDIFLKKMCELAYNKYLQPQKQTPSVAQYAKGSLNL